MLQISVDSSAIGETLDRLQAVAGDLMPAMIVANRRELQPIPCRVIAFLVSLLDEDGTVKM